MPEPAQAGTAAGGTSNDVGVSYNPALISQLKSGGAWYTSTYATAQSITYGFTTSSAPFTGLSEAAGWSAFTESQKTAVRQMMVLWDDLMAATLTEATSSPNTADIKFSNSTTNTSFAHAYFPGQVSHQTSLISIMNGSVWLNPNYNSGTNNLINPTPGIYGYMAIEHEIGHALGLEHGGNYNGGSPVYGDTSTGWLYPEDSRQFTIMSYFDASVTGAHWNGYAQTPMVYDILAIQQIYGADYTTRSGNTTYGFNSNAGNPLYDFNQNSSPILTIWDGNGVDTIDLSGWSSSSILNLTAGSYSSVDGMTNNLAIAYNVDIENAIGGSGNDSITGNDIGNTLSGGGGNDTINGAGGDDIINGGTGVDILIGGAGNDTIYFDALDNLSLLDGGSGFDTLIELGTYIAFDIIGHNFERLLDILTDTAAADWTQQTDYFDATGLHYECDITYDNGTRTVTEYDVYNSQTWSTRISTYASNGSLLSVVSTPDGGSPPPNSAPVISSNGAGTTAAINVAENTTAVTTVTATDVDAGSILAYSIAGGADAAKFTINAATGVLSFVTAQNFEAPTDVGGNNVYDVQVQVSDGTLTDIQALAVTVTNQNEAPVISSNGAGATAAVNVAENTTAVTTVTATDVDAGSVLAYSIAGGADAAKFVINATSGVLSFVTAQNFESPTDVGANNVYDVQVKVSDGTLTDIQALAVTVTNQNEAPVISSNGAGATAAINVAENTTAVTTVTATDVDAGSVLAYSIAGGADAAKFTINAATGVLSFVIAQNFEAPTDVGANNVYDVQVQVSDGSLTDIQALAVTVTNQNEAPVISSNGAGATAAINVAENTTAVTTVTATDVDAGSVLAYSIAGGADAAKFTINATTGVLSFVTAQNFEAPADVGANNVYDVQVKVSDGTLTDIQALAVTVTNVDEGVTGTAGNDVLTATSGNPNISGLAGDDTLNGSNVLSLSGSQATVFRLYQASLDREPDLAGINFHVKNLANGVSLQTVAASFVNSPEFTAKYGNLDNSHFVTQLYANVLHRAPDAGGLAYWTHLLSTGATRATILTGFSESAEFSANTLYDTEAFATDVFASDHIGSVFRLYGAALGREPDTSGFQSQVQAMSTGLPIDSIASNFLNSPEFQAVYGSLANNQFVALLYNNVLHRAPDAGGLAYWLGQMDNGATRTSVLLGFSESPEYTNNTSASLHSFIDHNMAATWSDTLDGGMGNDTLIGGLGSDTFVFDALLTGTDQIYGFDTFDHVVFNGFGFANLADVTSHMSQTGADVVFSDLNETITFHHLQLATLQNSDIFVFG